GVWGKRRGGGEQGRGGVSGFLGGGGRPPQALRGVAGRPSLFGCYATAAVQSDLAGRCSLVVLALEPASIATLPREAIQPLDRASLSDSDGASGPTCDRDNSSRRRGRRSEARRAAAAVRRDLRRPRIGFIDTPTSFHSPCASVLVSSGSWTRESRASSDGARGAASERCEALVADSDSPRRIQRLPRVGASCTLAKGRHGLVVQPG